MYCIKSGHIITPQGQKMLISRNLLKTMLDFLFCPIQLYIELYYNEEKTQKNQKINFKLAFRFGKIPKIINARCGRQRFLRFKGTWSGVGHPEMPPLCLELNSDDFPFFRNPLSTSRNPR